MTRLFVLYFITIKVINKFVNVIMSRIQPYRDYAFLKCKGVDTKFGYVKLIGLPHIHKVSGSTIKIAKGCTLISKTRGNYAGINHQVILATTTASAEIIIGENFGASGSAIVAQKSIIIGNDSGLGANSHLYDTDFHPVGWRINTHVKSSPITIGNHVWVSSNCIILKGVKLANDTVVGAGSIVTSSTSEGCVIAGKKAEYIRPTFK